MLGWMVGMQSTQLPRHRTSLTPDSCVWLSFGKKRHLVKVGERSWFKTKFINTADRQTGCCTAGYFDGQTGIILLSVNCCYIQKINHFAAITLHKNVAFAV